ncbi:MAG: hypothetical protein LKJ76_00445 [Lachnospiraceae bacterium]|jgi:hypothetical protein|nr:hypothetical protein [Lachnospiraceae bacterium]
MSSDSRGNDQDIELPSLEEIEEERKRILHTMNRRKTTILATAVAIVVAIDVLLACLLTGVLSWSSLFGHFA